MTLFVIYRKQYACKYVTVREHSKTLTLGDPSVPSRLPRLTMKECKPCVYFLFLIVLLV